MPGRPLYVWTGFRSQQGFPGRDRVFWSYVVIGVPCVATWFTGFMQLLGHDRVFPCRDSVLFLCRDNVATKVSLSRSRRS